MNPKTRRHVDGRPRPRRRTPPHPRPRGHQDFVRVLLVIQCVGSTGGAAGPHYLATGKLELLSESQFVDCDHEEDACGLVMRRRQWRGGRISGKNQLTKYSCARVHTDQARLRTMQRILLWLVLSLSPYMMREMWDLSSNFFLSDDDIGKNRAVAWVSKLQELNNVVDISALTEELTTEHLSKFQEIAWTHVI